MGPEATLSIALVFHPVWFWSFVFVFGLTIGSFLNVVIYRLPAILDREWTRYCREILDQPVADDTSGINLAFPASHCPHCGTPLRVVENVPVLSFLWQRGRCRHCHQAISWRYPAVELATAALSVATVHHFGIAPQTLAALALTWALIVLTWIDLERQLLPDIITLPLVWAGLAANEFGLFTSLSAAVWGAIAGYSSLWLLFQIFKWVTGKIGMGHGDFKLFAVAGAWLGALALPLVILMASFAGAAIGLTLIALKRQDRETPIPFGPFLCAGIWIGLLWQGPLLAAYLQFAR